MTHCHGPLEYSQRSNASPMGLVAVMALLAALLAPGRAGAESAGAIQPAELVAVADTALVEGTQWGDAPGQPLGGVRELALANLPDRRSRVLARFDLRPLRAAHPRRVARARLGLAAMGLSASDDPARIEVRLVAPDFAWDEETLTSEQWHSARRSGQVRFVGEPLGSGLFQYAPGQAQWRTLSLDPAPLEAALASGWDQATLLLECAPSMAPGALAVASRQFEGLASAMRLTLWHDGAWLPDLDPDFLPWDSERTRALAGQTAVGPGGVGVAWRDDDGGSGVRMELFLPAGLDGAAAPSGWVDMPCPPLDLDRYALAFRLEPLSAPAGATVTLTVASLGLDGPERVWRHGLAVAAGGEGEGSAGPLVFQLGPDDFVPLASDRSDQALPGGAGLSRPAVRWTLETASTAPVRVAVTDFSATAPEAAPLAPLRSVASPLFLALTAEQLASSAAAPWLAALGDGGADWGLAVVARGPDGLAGALGSLPGSAVALETTVAGLTAGAVSAREAWTTFEDGSSPNLARRLTPDGLWNVSAASLLAPATAEALATPVRQSGADLFILREPTWPRQGGVANLLGGQALWERERLRGFLSGAGQGLAWMDGASARPGERVFLDLFEADYGFRPGAGWFGLGAWEQFVPVFRWSDHPDGALERRRWLLTRALVRYAWLEFVGAAARHVHGEGNGEAFWLALAGDDPWSGADPWNALHQPGIDGVLLRRPLTSPTLLLDEAAHLLPLRRREADRLGKGIGLALDLAGGDGRSAFLVAYAWQAAGAGAAVEADLSALGREAFTDGAARRAQAVWAGAQAARSDGARPARRREILVLGDSPAQDGARPFDGASAFPNLTALLARSNVDFDYAPLAQGPRDLTPWRVVVWNGTNMGERWRERLADWLRGDAHRALVCLGAAPSRDVRSDALWANAQLTLNPAEVVDRDGGRALGLTGLARRALASPVFMIETVAPPYANHIAPRTLLSPASQSLYDYDRPEGVRVPLALEGGFPLISRRRPYSQGGTVVYIHYHMGLPATAQRAFDLAVLQGLLDDLGCLPAPASPGARVIALVAEGRGAGAASDRRPPVAVLLWPLEPDGGRTLEMALASVNMALENMVAVDALSGERFEGETLSQGRIRFAFAESAPRLLYIGHGANGAVPDGTVALF